MGRNLARVGREDLLILNERSTETEQALDNLVHWIPASRIAVLEPPSPEYGASVRTAHGRTIPLNVTLKRAAGRRREVFCVGCIHRRLGYTS